VIIEAWERRREQQNVDEHATQRFQLCSEPLRQAFSTATSEQVAFPKDGGQRVRILLVVGLQIREGELHDLRRRDRLHECTVA
jgi:hypothetical protein